MLDHSTTRLIIKEFESVDYLTTYQAMQHFTQHRTSETADEVWILQHPSVYTLGMAAQPSHILQNPDHLPIYRTDRGGQVTYHGPGQLIAYTLLDLSRRKWGVKYLVWLLEELIIRYLATLHLQGHRQQGAPGVYVDRQKIAALGLRIRRNCSYHGLSLNVAMDLSPYSNLNPCGYPQLKITQLRDLGISTEFAQLQHQFKLILLEHLDTLAD